MNYSIIKKIKNPFIISTEKKHAILKHRQEIKDIIAGRDSRLLIILGPCSAWPKAAVIEYAKRLKELESDISKQIKLVLRLYPHKSRSCIGWPGPIYQWNPLTPADIEQGMQETAELIDELLDLDLALGSEIINTHFFEDYWALFSWLAVGARASESTEHRIFASFCDMAVGMKNPSHGDLLTAVHSVKSAQHPHISFYKEHEIQSHGNEYAHLVLRGSRARSNYHHEDLNFVQTAFQDYQIRNPAIIIDASHGNCQKNHRNQANIILDILANLKQSPSYHKLIKGYMLESFILDGKQDIHAALNHQGLSITDPCLSWEASHTFLLKLHSMID